MVVKTILSQNRQDTLFRNACFPQFLFDLLFLGTVYPAEQQPKQPPGCGACKEQLHRQGHDEIPAIGHKVIGEKLAGKAVAVPYAQNAGQGHLGDHRKDLDGKNDENRPVTGLYHPEGKMLGHPAGNEVSTEKNNDEFQPHSLESAKK